MKKLSCILICCIFLYIFLFLCTGCITKKDNDFTNEVENTENSPVPAISTDKNPQITPAPTETKPENTTVNTVEVNEAADKVDKFPVITKELYDRTFNEIDLLIKNINDLIERKNYNEWVKYLSDEYIKTKSNSDYLKEISQLPVIKSKNLIIFDLKDYFFYVIVPSNTKAKLEKISFIDDNHVKAYGTIFNKSGILYYFEKINGQWKIGIF